MATSLPTSHNRRMILTSAAVVAVGLGAYGLGRVYPPTGSTAGTIAPADRYVSSQLSDSDVTLGDTAGAVAGSDATAALALAAA